MKRFIGSCFDPSDNMDGQLIIGDRCRRNPDYPFDSSSRFEVYDASSKRWIRCFDLVEIGVLDGTANLVKVWSVLENGTIISRKEINE